jgi:hypothetical protein
MIRLCMVAFFVCLALGGVKPASAATISLNNRSDCNCVSMGMATFCYCYASGTVTMDQPSSTLTNVDCYVGGSFAGTQTSGFNHVPNTVTWGYAFCCTSQAKQTGTGPHQTQDIAYGSGMYLDDDYRNWSP